VVAGGGGKKGRQGHEKIRQQRNDKRSETIRREQNERDKSERQGNDQKTTGERRKGEREAEEEMEAKPVNVN